MRAALIFGLAFSFVILGPFEAKVKRPFPIRLTYWVVLLAGAAVCVRPIQWVGQRYVPEWETHVRLVFEAVGFTLLFSPLAWLMSSAFTGAFLSVWDFLSIMGNVLALTSISAVLTYLLAERADTTAQGRARLYARLPPNVTAEIIRLTVNDHYVAIFLDDGTDHRILMRLADAVGEMDGVPGFHTHRSHWVSQAHVTRRLRYEGRDYLVVSDGSRVPISKTYQKNVAAAGFV